MPPNPPEFVDLLTNFHAVALGADGKTAWAAGGNGMLYCSTDGGASWTWVDAPGTGALLGLYFNDDLTRGWAVGEGRIVYSNDGGSSWRQSQNVPRVELRRVLFDEQGKHGFAVGAVVLETEDGGISWKRRQEQQGIRCDCV
jgi:photosystem II stability/assembly factor-like uncharacterized protein